MRVRYRRLQLDSDMGAARETADKYGSTDNDAFPYCDSS